MASEVPPLSSSRSQSPPHSPRTPSSRERANAYAKQVKERSRVRLTLPGTAKLSATRRDPRDEKGVSDIASSHLDLQSQSPPANPPSRRSRSITRVSSKETSAGSSAETEQQSQNTQVSRASRRALSPQKKTTGTSAKHNRGRSAERTTPSFAPTAKELFPALERAPRNAPQKTRLYTIRQIASHSRSQDSLEVSSASNRERSFSTEEKVWDLKGVFEAMGKKIKGNQKKYFENVRHEAHYNFFLRKEQKKKFVFFWEFLKDRGVALELPEELSIEKAEILKKQLMAKGRSKFFVQKEKEQKLAFFQEALKGQGIVLEEFPEELSIKEAKALSNRIVEEGEFQFEDLYEFCKQELGKYGVINPEKKVADPQIVSLYFSDTDIAKYEAIWQSARNHWQTATRFREIFWKGDKTSLPECIDYFFTLINDEKWCQTVTSLNLSGLGLTWVPQVLSKLVNLTELNLSKNKLSELVPSNWEELEALVKARELDWDPRALSQLLIHLKTLDLSENNFPELVLSDCRELETLVASDNPLTGLPLDFGENFAIRNLYLCRTRMKTLPQLPIKRDSKGNIVRIIFYFSGNPLTKVGWDYNFEGIQLLDLQKTDLQYFPVPILAKLTGITVRIQGTPLNEFYKHSPLPSNLIHKLEIE